MTGVTCHVRDHFSGLIYSMKVLESLDSPLVSFPHEVSPHPILVDQPLLTTHDSKTQG